MSQRVSLFARNVCSSSTTYLIIRHLKTFHHFITARHFLLFTLIPRLVYIKSPAANPSKHTHVSFPSLFPLSFSLGCVTNQQNHSDTSIEINNAILKQANNSHNYDNLPVSAT